MRIIAGSAGGRRLKTPRGDSTRPTADRVRESIFNVLVARTEVPARVLDLYAGSGALGLEALSRGAEAAVFVEQAKEAREVITENAQALGFASRVRVVPARVLDYLKRPADAPAGWVFLDPPYGLRELDRAILLADEGGFVAPGGVVVAEHDVRKPPADRIGGLALWDRRRYGQTAVSFYSREAP